jgi:ParB family chromosome partitioning protein
MSNLYTNSIFFIDTDKINPNPFQPRREFEPGPLQDLSESIRQYGVLQPLVVSRVERETPDGGLATEYELIAGERRLRASRMAGLTQVPAIIRVGDDNMMKLEIAIIENLQREDLNAVERARAFARLVDEFKFTHTQIGQKMGKSREFVSNSIRILALPQEILDALSSGKINEGHTRPLMMLSTRPEEQLTLFKEIMFRKITVREAERIARRIAVDKVRKKELLPNAELMQIEQKLQESLGTRVHIEPKEAGGKITIDYFSPEDLDGILKVFDGAGQSVMVTRLRHLRMFRLDRSKALKKLKKKLNSSKIEPLKKSPRPKKRWMTSII